jgi:hypothetical protein
VGSGPVFGDFHIRPEHWRPNLLHRDMTCCCSASYPPSPSVDSQKEGVKHLDSVGASVLGFRRDIMRVLASLSLALLGLVAADKPRLAVDIKPDGSMVSPQQTPDDVNILPCPLHPMLPQCPNRP